MIAFCVNTLKPTASVIKWWMPPAVIEHPDLVDCPSCFDESYANPKIECSSVMSFFCERSNLDMNKMAMIQQLSLLFFGLINISGLTEHNKEGLLLHYLMVAGSSK